MIDDNGGSAFPISVLGETLKGQEGMSLRDYLAAKAMQAIVTGIVSKGEGTETEELDIVSKASYLVADAMLKARQQ